MIDELRASQESLLAETSMGLASLIRKRLQSLTQNIFVLHWIPEEDEDLFDVLVDGKTVVHMEIPRRAPRDATVFQQWTVEEYLKTRTLTKPDRRKLKLALELAQANELDLGTQGIEV
jgi:hypothetical protein